MRQSNDFSLFMISDVPYLLPFGQGIADLKRGVQINDTGAYLWNLLDKERTEDELLSLYAAHYEVTDSRLPQLREDLQQFLCMLDSYGMLSQTGDTAGNRDMTADIPAPAACANTQAAATIPSGNGGTGSNDNTVPACVAQRYLSIGGLTLLLRGPDNVFSRDFDAFEIFPDPGTVPDDTAFQSAFQTDPVGAGTGSAFHVDQTITVTDHAPLQRPASKLLLKSRELAVMENDLQYIFFFPDAPGIYEAHLSKDGADSRYYCRPPYTEHFRQDLFHAIRLSFLYLAQLHDMVVLHSASLLYRDKAWLFSGYSGAGKSTHTNLWKELYGVPLINGDLNLLSMENGHPTVHGMPWCGTSGIADTHSYPLGGILLVKKSQQNYVDTLDDSHAQLLVTQRLISPGWTASLVQKNLRLVAELAPHILICRLHCTKTPEAAEAGKKAIDDFYNES